MSKLKPYALNALVTTLTALVLYMGYTAYVDHTIVRALLQIEQARQAAPKAP